MCPSQCGLGWGGLGWQSSTFTFLINAHTHTTWKTPTPGPHIQTDDISFPLISLYLCPLFLFPLLILSLYLPIVGCVCVSVNVCCSPPWIQRKIGVAARKRKRPSCVFADVFWGGVSRNARSAAACQDFPPQLWIISVFGFFLLLLFLHFNILLPPANWLIFMEVGMRSKTKGDLF